MRKTKINRGDLDLVHVMVSDAYDKVVEAKKMLEDHSGNLEAKSGLNDALQGLHDTMLHWGFVL
ncbi:hypothetical protein LCGC14_1018480 [marine sediment metagenome]|uniref:Uncharacterized protein n=1 Tax=marine sediment metagenome TaxID=412755 RepID=A0A0F9QGB7_9ZZZZ